MTIQFLAPALALMALLTLCGGRRLQLCLNPRRSPSSLSASLGWAFYDKAQEVRLARFITALRRILRSIHDWELLR